MNRTAVLLCSLTTDLLVAAAPSIPVQTGSKMCRQLPRIAAAGAQLRFLCRRRHWLRHQAANVRPSSRFCSSSSFSSSSRVANVFLNICLSQLSVMHGVHIVKRPRSTTTLIYNYGCIKPFSNSCPTASCARHAQFSNNCARHAHARSRNNRNYRR